MEFEYAVISTALETIDIEDIAKCYLCASDGIYEYYLKLYTDIGETVHETFGPLFKLPVRAICCIIFIFGILPPFFCI